MMFLRHLIEWFSDMLDEIQFRIEIYLLTQEEEEAEG